MKLFNIIFFSFLATNAYAISDYNFEGKITSTRSSYLANSIAFTLDSGQPKECKGARNKYIIVPELSKTTILLIVTSNSNDIVKGEAYLSKTNDCTTSSITRIRGDK